MRRRCASCEEPTLEHVRDQAVRGGAIEHWECRSCGARAEVPGVPTALLLGAIGAFFVGAALFSSRFSGSAAEIAIMRIGLGALGVWAIGYAAGKRAWLERRCPPVR